jgi:uncharacterized delta-60 repeat protein
MRSAIGFAIAGLVLLGSPVAHAGDANLDPSFGSYGSTSVDTPSAPDTGEDVAIQPDGKIVVVGSPGFTAHRFTSAGALDATFGTGGTASVSLGTYGAARALALQNDGRIVAVGTADATSTTDPGMVAVRFDTDGSLDGTFGTGGIAKVNIAVGAGYEVAQSVAIQADGSLVLAGERFDETGPDTFHSNIKVVRLLANGSLDASFGTGGIVSLGLAGWAEANDVVVQPDGDVVVGGYEYVPYFSGSEQAFLLARLDSAGVLDPGFGAAGIVIRGPEPQGSSIGNSVVLQPDGKILLGGLAGYVMTVARFLPNGSADGAFGTGGIATVVYENNDTAYGNDLVLRPDGKMVIVGNVRRNGNGVDDTAIARFNADGSPDTTFTPTGRARIVIGPRRSQAMAIARQADGKMVVSGWTNDQPWISFDGSVTALTVERFGSSSCGNAFLDAGEQCDDGNTNGLDCCSAGCGYDPAGQICDGDASICTWDTCNGSGTCSVGGARPVSECASVTQPLKSSLIIKDDPANTRDKITWKWTKGADTFYYGQPGILTDYSLCVFGGSSLASENEIPSGLGWTGTSKGWLLKRDPFTTPGGIGRAALLFGGPGKSKITVKGKGPLVGAPAIPLATPVTAQLVTSEGLCFTAAYASPSANTGGRFKGKGQ